MLKPTRFASRFTRSGDVIPFAPRNVGHRVGTVVLVLALMLLAAANVKPDLADGPGSAAPVAGNPNAAADFVYFPGQYVINASEPTEHIQSF